VELNFARGRGLFRKKDLLSVGEKKKEKDMGPSTTTPFGKVGLSEGRTASSRKSDP